MNEISPTISATLAARIYDVQNPMLIDIFLKLPYFLAPDKTGSSPNTHLKAEVGGRVILNVQDGFGVCAHGGKGYENEIFLIFEK